MAPVVRPKPALAAADGVSTTVPALLTFFGTSAATPSAAGIATLIRSAAPSLTASQVRTTHDQPDQRSGLRRRRRPRLDCGAGFIMADLTVHVAQREPPRSRSARTGLPERRQRLVHDGGRCHLAGVRPRRTCHDQDRMCGQHGHLKPPLPLLLQRRCRLGPDARHVHRPLAVHLAAVGRAVGRGDHGPRARLLRRRRPRSPRPDRRPTTSPAASRTSSRRSPSPAAHARHRDPPRGRQPGLRS